jgi:integrase
LGVRISANEGKAAVLAGHTVAILRSTGPQACKGDQERDLPYIPTHLGTLLNANGENAKVVQELLRHASLKVTTDVYMQAVSSQKREAQSKLVNMVMNAAVPAK